MGGPYEAGYSGGGFRAGMLSNDSGLRLKTVTIPIDDNPDYLVTSVVPPAVGAAFTLLTGGFLPYPMSVACRFITDATVINRSLTVRVTGIDVFGAGKTENLVWDTIPASQTEDRFTARCFTRVDRIEVVSIVNADAGDRCQFGMQVDALQRYGIPIEVRRITDIIGGCRLAAGIPPALAVDFGTGTVDLTRHTIRDITGPADGNLMLMTVISSRDKAG